MGLEVEKMDLQIEKGLLLYNMRLEESNIEAGRPWDQGFKLHKDLAFSIWPHSKFATIYMSQLINGKKKTIRINVIRILSYELKIDPNFICGFPSMHDADYKILSHKYIN